MGAAFKHLAVQRHLVSRANPQAIANLDLVQRDIGLAAVVIQFPGRRRGEVQESPDGAGGFLARPQLQHLPEQHQDHDDRCRLEIHGNRTTVLPEGIREDLRHQGGHQAVDQGDTGAEGNQREHVQMPTDHGFPGPDKEGPTAPEHDRRCQHQLNPVGQLRGHDVPEPGEMAAHFKHQDRQGQDQSDPESARHVLEFRGGAVIQAHLLRFQGHAADGAITGALLANFRMHGAGVHGIRRHRFFSLLLVTEVLLRVCIEAGLTA